MINGMGIAKRTSESKRKQQECNKKYEQKRKQQQELLSKRIACIINNSTFTDQQFLDVAYNLDADERAFYWVTKNINHYEKFEETAQNGDDIWTGYIIAGHKYYTHHFYNQNDFRSANYIRYLDLNDGKQYFE